MNITAKIGLLACTSFFIVTTAGAQIEPETSKQGTVILYDAETIARINAIPKPPNYPLDISEQYEEYVLGIPVITNSKHCGQSKLEIRMRVDNVKNAKGYIVADLHNHIEADFLDPEKVVLRVRASALKGSTSLCIPLMQPGDYAIAIYHDKNSNRRFDKGFLRIPKERFGMSNNPKFKLESPTYGQAAFPVPEEGADITVRLVKASEILSGQK